MAKHAQLRQYDGGWDSLSIERVVVLTYILAKAAERYYNSFCGAMICIS